MDILQEKFNKQLLLWDAKITESITTAVNAVLSTEMAKFSTMLHEINNNIVKLNSDNAHINKTLSENTKKLDEIEKSFNFMSERQDTFDYRMTSRRDSAILRCPTCQNDAMKTLSA
jgi:uncharacterized coiled-coil DUF342 family protein